MRVRLGRWFVLGFAPTIIAARALLAVDIPLVNWSVPARPDGITTMDNTLPLPFIGLAPCRIVDTRGNGAPITGGKFGAGESRDYLLPGICGLPVLPRAVSLNVTVTETDGPGFLSVYPSGPFPGTSTINYTTAGATIGNAAIVPLSSGGGISVTAGVSGTHVVIDINGYFANQPASGLPFVVQANSFYAILGQNSSADQNVKGVVGLTSFAANSAGVYGSIVPEFPVQGCCGPAGVRGQGAHVGVLGLAKELGVAGRVYDDAGNTLAGGDLGVRVHPLNSITYGLHGASLTNAGGSAGVRGVDYSGEPSAPGLTCCSIAGVRGSSFSHHGVNGVSRDGIGVSGYNKNAIGDNATFALLGVTDTIAIQYSGELVGPMAASVVEPHPTDASKALRYTSLEGNEAGTYFRGRGKFERGLARIAVPEDFRMITDPEGLTVQITPIGEMASYAVVRVGLDEIVVKSSRNVEFFYAVNGVRRAYRALPPIVSSEEFFMPASADERLPTHFSPYEKRRLIENGTYNADGSVNMETAKRLGWTRLWEERKREQEAALARSRSQSSPARASGTGP